VSPSASILIPTRGRRHYLAVTLASAAPQASEHGAEVVVVEDDARDPATERLALEHGARYLSHGETRGLNAARNTAIGAAAADLLCFLDDDVELWPGWLSALLAASAACPDHLVLGGPIRARLEGTNLRACGREPAPITTLDLGPVDRDAEFVWGANLALRRRALALVGGGFDETLDIYGDEEDLQRRLHAAGGRVRYVAAAGVDHRRTGADARIAGLSRAAYRRGRHSRRYDERKGTVPSVPSELRTLAGCLAHIVRFRCGNGMVLTAQTGGRLREALLPGPRRTADPDFLSGESGTLNRRLRARAKMLDVAADARALPQRRAGASSPPRRVLVISVARPEHAAISSRTLTELERSKHVVTVRMAEPAPGTGKWANVNAALAAYPVEGHDWLLLVDDDVAIPRRFLDTFLAVCERHGFRLAQPAHAFESNAAWRVTRRRFGAVARRTRYVEIGPVTALHAETFSTLLPFPDLQMGWGLDNHWGAVAQEQGWPMGIVDLTPVRHLRPVAGSYPREAAIAEAHAFLADRPYIRRAEALETLETYR
jgi:GT2 family glycosyltransferase